MIYNMIISNICGHGKGNAAMLPLRLSHVPCAGD